MTPVQAGQFGDTFGFSNSVLSGLSLCGLVYTVLLQRIEIRMQARALDSSFDELDLRARIASRPRLKVHSHGGDAKGDALSIQVQNEGELMMLPTLKGRAPYSVTFETTIPNWGRRLQTIRIVPAGDPEANFGRVEFDLLFTSADGDRLESRVVYMAEQNYPACSIPNRAPAST